MAISQYGCGCLQANGEPSVLDKRDWVSTEKGSAGLVQPLAQSHVGIYVTDFERALDFYRRVFGFDVRYDSGSQDERRIIIGLIAGIAVEMTAAFAGVTPAPVDDRGMGIANISFSVSAIDDVHTVLAQEGLANMGAPVVLPSNIRLMLLRDPDGNLLELIDMGGAKSMAELFPQSR